MEISIPRPIQSTLFRETMIKVKVKLILEQATKAQRGRKCIALLFLQPRR